MNADKVYASYLGGGFEETEHFLTKLKVCLLEGGGDMNNYSDNFTDADSSNAINEAVGSGDESDISNLLASRSNSSSSSLHSFVREDESLLPENHGLSNSEVTKIIIDEIAGIDMSNINDCIDTLSVESYNDDEDKLYTKTTI